MALQMQAVFRFADHRDLPKLEWHGEYTHFRRVFQNAYEDQQAGRGIFLGFLGRFDDFGRGGKRSYLYSLRVMDAFQRKGIGTALVREAERILTERGFTAVSIAAAKDNPGARRLYERLGYQVITEDAGRWHYTDHEGRTRQVIEPCWILEKSLRGRGLG